jgi:hypothetical protein
MLLVTLVKEHYNLDYSMKEERRTMFGLSKIPAADKNSNKRLALIFTFSWALFFIQLHVFTLSANDEADQNVKPDRDSVFLAYTTAAQAQLQGLTSGQLPFQEFRDGVIAALEAFYQAGFISLEQFNLRKGLLITCENAQTQYERFRLHRDRQMYLDKRNEECEKAGQIQSLRNQAPSCIGAQALLAGGVCCQNMVAAVAPETMSFPVNCAKVNTSCSKHEDCCSKVCEKNEAGTPTGVCAQALACFAQSPLGQECSPQAPFCASGVCRPIDQGVDGVQCRSKDAACSQNQECCSGSCQSNKCAEVWKCSDCLTVGQKVVSGKVCCRGTLPIENARGEKICQEDLPPFILPQ